MIYDNYSKKNQADIINSLTMLQQSINDYKDNIDKILLDLNDGTLSKDLTFSKREELYIQLNQEYESLTKSFDKSLEPLIQRINVINNNRVTSHVKLDVFSDYIIEKENRILNTAKMFTKK